MNWSVQPLEPESYEALSALFRPLGKRACPLYRRAGGRAYDLIGTAIPVRGLKYAALLTASHVLDQLDEGHITVGGSHTFLRFPATTVRFSHSRRLPAVDVDVAAIALPSAAAKELADYYEFTGAGEVGEFEDFSKFSLYGFVGCPHTKNKTQWKRSAERLVKPYFYATREYAALPATGGKRSAVHVALQAPLRTATGAEGRIMAAPDPHGISGCGVWKIKLDPATGLGSRPQLVGIGIEHNRGTFIATRMSAGAVVIARLWKHLDDGVPPPALGSCVKY